MANRAAIEALRAKVRALEDGPRLRRRRVGTGVDSLDHLVGGLPQPGLVELCGRPGTGRTRLAVQLVAAMTQRRRRAAWVDQDRTLYPPALEAVGVGLRRLWIVHPPEDGLHGPAWAMEQLLRSGCFPLVVMSGGGQLSYSIGQRWARACEQGGCTALLIRERPTRAIPAELRLGVGQGKITVLRDRGGHGGGEISLESLPIHLDPWAA